LKPTVRRDILEFLGPFRLPSPQNKAPASKGHTFCEVINGGWPLGIRKSGSFAVMSAFLAFADILPTPMDIALLMAGVLGMIAGLNKK